MKKAFFLFTGEFGYEIISFQGILRKLRSNFETLYVCSYKESKIFYEDFVDKFVEIPEWFLSKFDRSDSLNTMSDEDINKLVGEYENDGFNVYHRRKIFNDYPLDIKLDLTGDFGKYPPLNTKKNQNENIITLFPRIHTTHEHRNYNINKFNIFLEKIIKQFVGFEINVVLFNDNFQSDLTKVNYIIRPDIKTQLNLQAVSKFVIYNVSGSVFLNVMNSEKTPIFMYGIKSDLEKFPENNIFTKKGINYKYVFETDNVSDIEPEYLFDSLIDFYKTV